MRALLLTLFCLALFSCSDGDIEKFAFRETLQYKLKELCGEEDKQCITAVEEQTDGCMEQSNWRQYLKDQDNEEEYKRFMTSFYACLVDPLGDPYFVANV